MLPDGPLIVNRANPFKIVPSGPVLYLLRPGLFLPLGKGVS